MAKQSKIKIALETIEALRRQYRLEYLAALNRWNDGEVNKEVEILIQRSRMAEQTCQKVIFILEDIEVKANADKRDRRFVP